MNPPDLFWFFGPEDFYFFLRAEQIMNEPKVLRGSPLEALKPAAACKEALELLLYPDGVEPNRYYLSMASQLHKFRIRIRDIPEPLFKIFYELLASGGRTFRRSDGHEFFVRLLFKIPPNLVAWLFEKRFPLCPFIEHIDAKRIFPGIGQPSQILRKRWRT